MDNKIIGQRIKIKREELGYTQEDIAKELGLNKSTIQRYETGNIQRVKLPIIEAIAKLLKVNPSWLAGKIDVQEEEPNYFIYDNISPISKQKIPLLGEIACGKPIYADEHIECYVEAGANIHADFCLKAKGDSMIGARILDGDIVFIRKQDMVEDGEIAAVIIENEATLKRVYYDKENNLLKLVAENPNIATMVYSGEELNQIHILGKAIAFQSDVK